MSGAYGAHLWAHELCPHLHGWRCGWFWDSRRVPLILIKDAARKHWQTLNRPWLGVARSELFSGALLLVPTFLLPYRRRVLVLSARTGKCFDGASNEVAVSYLLPIMVIWLIWDRWNCHLSLLYPLLVFSKWTWASLLLQWREASKTSTVHNPPIPMACYIKWC